MVNKCSIRHAVINQFFFELMSVSLKHGFCIGCFAEVVYTVSYVLIAGMTSESYCTALQCIKALVSFVQ